MAQQLQSFTRRMMEGVITAHSIRTAHDKHCCQVAYEYTVRLSGKTSSVPQGASKPSGTVPAPAPIDVRPITPAQAKYIRNLRRQVALGLLSPQHRSWVETVSNGDEIRFNEARDLLEAMVSLADRTPSARRFPEPSYIPELGPYKIGDDVYLVVKVKDGDRRYAKRFNTNSHKFEYAGQKPFDLLTEDGRMTAQDAKEFGDLYSVCCNCGLRLTKRHSQDLGYGPVCAERNNWPY